MPDNSHSQQSYRAAVMSTGAWTDVRRGSQVSKSVTAEKSARSRRSKLAYRPSPEKSDGWREMEGFFQRLDTSDEPLQMQETSSGSEHREESSVGAWESHVTPKPEAGKPRTQQNVQKKQRSLESLKNPKVQKMQILQKPVFEHRKLTENQTTERKKTEVTPKFCPPVASTPMKGQEKPEQNIKVMAVVTEHLTQLFKSRVVPASAKAPANHIACCYIHHLLTKCGPTYRQHFYDNPQLARVVPVAATVLYAFKNPKPNQQFPSLEELFTGLGLDPGSAEDFYDYQRVLQHMHASLDDQNSAVLELLRTFIAQLKEQLQLQRGLKAYLKIERKKNEEERCRVLQVTLDECNKEMILLEQKLRQGLTPESVQRMKDVLRKQFEALDLFYPSQMSSSSSSLDLIRTPEHEHLDRVELHGLHILLAVLCHPQCPEDSSASLLAAAAIHAAQGKVCLLSSWGELEERICGHLEAQVAPVADWMVYTVDNSLSKCSMPRLPSPVLPKRDSTLWTDLTQYQQSKKWSEGPQLSKASLESVQSNPFTLSQPGKAESFDIFGN